MSEQGVNIAAAVHHMQNQHDIILPDAMDDEVVVNREATQAGPQIVVARAPGRDTAPTARNARQCSPRRG